MAEPRPNAPIERSRPGDLDPRRPSTSSVSTVATFVLVHGGGHGGRRGRLWSIDTGHDLMITEPAFVADTLGAIAAA